MAIRVKATPGKICLFRSGERRARLSGYCYVRIWYWCLVRCELQAVSESV